MMLASLIPRPIPRAFQYRRLKSGREGLHGDEATYILFLRHGRVELVLRRGVCALILYQT